MLGDGGNAVDAALAANLVLGVVTPYMCGFGGDLLTMVWDGDVNAYRGVGRAPAASTAAAVRDQSGADAMPVFGPHPVTVPGAVDGWFTMLSKWGTRRFGDVAARALRYAEDGFPVTKRGAWFFANSASSSRTSVSTTSTRYYGDVQPGTGSVSPSSHARFARSPPTDRTCTTAARSVPRSPTRIQDAGGFMTEADIAGPPRRVGRAAARAQFRGTEILEMPPPTQGMTALEALRIVDGLDLGADGPDREHLLIEAVKCALADRRQYLGDPDAMTIAPEVLLADDWVADRPRGASIPTGPNSSSRVRHRTAARSTCARPTATACSSASSSRTSRRPVRACAWGSGG